MRREDTLRQVVALVKAYQANWQFWWKRREWEKELLTASDRIEDGGRVRVGGGNGLLLHGIRERYTTVAGKYLRE